MSELEQQIPTEKEIRDLLPEYVMGNLDAGKLSTVIEYLPRYIDLQEEVRSLENTVMQLAYCAPTATPPKGSRERILARARMDGEQARANGTAPIPALAGSSSRRSPSPSEPIVSSTHIVRYGAPQPPQIGPQRFGLLRQISEWWRNAIGWKMYALATSVALALLAGIFNQTQNELQRTLVEMAALQTQSAQLTEERERLAVERDRLAGERAEREVYFSQLKAEDDALIDNLKRTLQTVDSANTELRETVTQLEISTSELMAANTQLEDSNARLETSNGDLLQNNLQLEEAGAALAADNATLQQAVEALELQLSAQNRFWTIFPTIRRIVTMEATSPNLPASGTLWSSADGSFLLFDGLAPLPEERSYQLWLITEDEDTVDSGVIAISSESLSPISVELPLGIGEIAAVALSIEPAGGSNQPTDVVLLGLRSPPQ